MKALIHHARTIILFVSLSGLTAIHAQPLSGIYTINAGGAGDYSSVTAAVADLQSNGISGAVTFNIASGTYNEQVTMGAIAGVSASDTILFQSASGDSTSVVITFSSTGSGNNYIIQMSGSSYITFRSVTLQNTGQSFSRCVDFSGGNSHIRFERCELVSGVNNTSSTNHALVFSPNSVNDSEIRFNNNRFVKGGNAIYNQGGTSNSAQPGWRIVNNRFDEYHFYGVYLNQCGGAIVSGNTFANNVAAGSTGSRAIFLSNGTGACTVSNNIINTRGSYGIYLGSQSASSFDPSLVFNNMVSINGGTSYGINVASCDHLNLYHNSVNLYSTSGSSRNIFTTSGSNIKIHNNIASNWGLGYAIYVNTASAIAASDYNNLFTAGCYLGYWGSNRVNLQQWQSGSGQDQNSLSVDPRWNSHTDLRTTYIKMANVGLNLLASVPVDIDGDIRAATPCLGADEFVPTAVVPLSGVLNVPGTYSTIQAALDDIRANGIVGSVEIRIADGTYNEQVIIRDFDRAASSDTLLIQSASGDSSKVSIQYTASGTGDNYVLLINRTTGVTIRDIGVTAAGTSYSRGIVLVGNTGDVRIERCLIQANPTTSGSTNFSAIFGDDVAATGVIIAQNTILNNGHGIYLSAYPGCSDLADVVVRDNVMLDQGYRGVYLERVNTPMVLRNEIISPTSSTSFYGIYGTQLNGAARILENRIQSQGNRGIYLNTATATALNPGIIANNMVSMMGGSAYGVQLNSVSFYRIYHNSILCSGTGSSSIVMYTSSGSGLDIRNNIFANYGTGRAVYINTTSAVSNLDYNVYHTRGCFIGYWSGNRGTLSEWQTASGRDLNSHQFHPRFNSTTDLHSSYFELIGLGTNLGAVVGMDIDGDIRPTSPCPGADEFTANVLTPITGTITVPGQYATLDDAFDAIYEAGISGTVTIDIADGTYMGRTSIGTFIRANPTDSLIIQSASGDSSKVTLQYTASGTSDNYILYMVSPANVVIRNLTFVSAGTTYGRAFLITEQVEGLTVANCAFVSNVTSGSSDNGAIIYGKNIWGNDLTIRQSRFDNGSHAITLANPNNCQGFNNVTIEHNSLRFQVARGIELNRFANAYVRYNSVEAAGGSTSLYPIYITSNSGDMEIWSNQVAGNGPYGIYLTSCSGSALNPLLIANNMVSMAGGSSNAVYMGSCTYVRFYHNSLHCYNTTSGSSRALYTSSGSNLDVRNNIMVQSGTNGYAWYNGTPAAVTVSDYNLLHSPSADIGYWSGARADLSAWQSASGQDANSLDTDPQFRSNTDLHILNAGLVGSGVDLLVDVAVDIDGNPRNNPPFIGADEIRIDFAVSSVVSPQSGCLGTEPVTVQVANPGDAQDSVFVLRYQVNGGTVVVDTLNQLLEPQTSLNFTFSQTHDFSNTGSYTITAWITYAGDEGLTNDTVTVTVNSNPKPVAAFTGQNGCEGTALSFIDNSTVSSGTVVAWSWDFGDGTTDTSQHPTHVFTGTSGAVAVQLIATTDMGCADTVTNNLTIFPRPSASFTATVACEQMATQFTNTSTVSSGAITVYAWDFGGASSSQENPSHTFTSTGLNNVQLIVTTNAGCRDTTSQSVMVNPSPTADFLASGDVCLGESIDFTDISFIPSGVITGYLWEFGDGDTSNLQNDQHTYASAGTYAVTLTVVSDQQCAASETKQVEVFPLPVPDFAADDVCEGGTVDFTNNSTISTGSISQYNWSFGDGNGSNDTDPSHTYSGTGSFQVMLQATSDEGCIDSTTKQVDVFPNPPKPTISQSGNSLTTQSGYSYEWFLDGQLISGANTATISTSGSGAYTVVITDQNGCSDTSDPFVITGIPGVVNGWNVSIYPNPASQVINVQVQHNNTGAIWMQLTDLSGRLLVMNRMRGATDQLTVSQLAAGLYVVRLIDQDGIPVYQVPVEIIR